MSTIEERTAYLDNPFKTPSLFGDYSAFYVTIAICTVLGVFIFAVNIIFGCCSRHKSYWQDRHTGEFIIFDNDVTFPVLLIVNN